jgi:hypothetical protein
VLLDTGAGISEVVLYTVSLAGEVLVVATPEPTSLTDAYATIKVLATTQGRRRMHLWSTRHASLGEGRAVRQQLQQVVDRYVNPGLDSPVRLDLLGEIPPTRPCANPCSAASCCWKRCPARRRRDGAIANAACRRAAAHGQQDLHSGNGRHASLSAWAARVGRARAGRPLLRPDGPGAGLRRTAGAAPHDAGRIARQAALVSVRLAGRARPLRRAIRPPSAARPPHALPIGMRERDQWMACMKQAMQEQARGRPTWPPGSWPSRFFGTADWMRNR